MTVFNALLCDFGWPETGSSLRINDSYTLDQMAPMKSNKGLPLLLELPMTAMMILLLI